MNYPLPARAATAFARTRNRKQQNAGLVFDRYGPDWHDNAKLKQAGLEAARAAAEQGDARLLAAWNGRWDALVRKAGARPPESLFTLNTEWRFIAGLGRKGSLEVGFTFHRYGFPLLPGSSAKGIARAYASLIADRTPADPDFRAVFGWAGAGEDTGSAGHATFFDAIPAGPTLPRLQLDIMNPHYPDYYQGNRFPNDGQNPRPVIFLTVASNTPFRFAIGWRGALDADGERRQGLAAQWLRGGLLELGAGAKTSAGYGFFAEVQRVSLCLEGEARQEDPAPPPPVERLRSRGKIRQDRGRVFIADGDHHYPVDFKALRMDIPKDKTLVDYEYEALPDGKRKVVAVTKAKV